MDLAQSLLYVLFQPPPPPPPPPQQVFGRVKTVANVCVYATSFLIETVPDK